METADWIRLGGLATEVVVAIASVVLVLVVYRQLKGLNQQTRLQNFLEFTRRYRDIVLNFPENINDKSFVLSELKDEDYRKVMRYMRVYYDLCYEEWELRQSGDIDDDHWKVWRKGMKTAFSKPAFQQAWERMQSDTNFGDQFSDFVDELTPSATAGET